MAWSRFNLNLLKILLKNKIALANNTSKKTVCPAVFFILHISLMQFENCSSVKKPLIDL